MNNHAKTLRLAQLAMLVALEIILTFLPIGMIMVPPVAITLMHIPVIVGAVLLGPLHGGILGGTFGVCALIKATTAAVSPMDMAFSPFLSGKPLESVILCIVPRILLGVVAAYLFILLKKIFKNEVASIITAAIVSTAFHTVSVLGLMLLLFRDIALEGGVTLVAVFGTVVTLNGLLEMGAAALIATAICKPLLSYQRKRYV